MVHLNHSSHDIVYKQPFMIRNSSAQLGLNSGSVMIKQGRSSIIRCMNRPWASRFQSKKITSGIHCDSIQCDIAGAACGMEPKRHDKRSVPAALCSKQGTECGYGAIHVHVSRGQGKCYHSQLQCLCTVPISRWGLLGPQCS